MQHGVGEVAVIVVRRFPHVDGYSDAFVEAMWQLIKERGHVTLLKSDIEARAATIQIVQPLPRLAIVLPKLV